MILTSITVHNLKSARRKFERWSSDCDICLGSHDEEIHAATVNVHRWFRAQVTKGFRAAAPGNCIEFPGPKKAS